MARFLAVNWRDLKNPDAGGAEVHLHEILKRLVKGGHDATLITTLFDGGAETEVYDGIRVMRKGRWYNANFTLPFVVRSYVRRNPVDLVIDDINKIPFFVPAFVDKRVVAVVPHLFGITVYRETNPLFGTYVYLWEKLIPRVYRHCRFVAISQSTKDDLVVRGIREELIDVVHCGLDQGIYRRLDEVGRRSEPTIVHFGRMRKYKSIDVVVKAFVRIKQDLPNARLVIVGGGPEKPNLEKFARETGVSESIDFPGVLDTRQLVELLNQSHLFLNASPKEGWGLTVVEANACGVPVIASNRPGLRDSVLDGKTGFLVEYGDDREFAKRSIELLADRQRWQRFSDAAIEWARSLTWDRTAQEMERIFAEEIGRRRNA